MKTKCSKKRRMVGCVIILLSFTVCIFPMSCGDRAPDDTFRENGETGSIFCGDIISDGDTAAKAGEETKKTGEKSETTETGASGEEEFACDAVKESRKRQERPARQDTDKLVSEEKSLTDKEAETEEAETEEPEFISGDIAESGTETAEETTDEPRNNSAGLEEESGAEHSDTVSETATSIPQPGSEAGSGTEESTARLPDQAESAEESYEAQAADKKTEAESVSESSETESPAENSGAESAAESKEYSSGEESSEPFSQAPSFEYHSFCSVCGLDFDLHPEIDPMDHILEEHGGNAGWYDETAAVYGN